MANILITGTNRGIGLEFTSQCLRRGDTVYAVCRDLVRADALKQLQAANSALHLIESDIARPTSHKDLADKLAGVAIDIFINNAGVYGPRDASFGRVGSADWLDTFQINTIAPLLLTQALIENFRQGGEGKLAYLTSKMGSIADNTSGGSYVYRSSKTALNQVVRCLAHDLAGDGLIAVVLHPGWVKTDMGGSNALIDTATSVKGMLGVIDGLSRADSGGYFNYDGKRIPW